MNRVLDQLADSSEQHSASPGSLRRRTTAHCTRSGPGSTPGSASATSPSGCAARANDLQLTQYDEKGWGATFYTPGREHSPTSATGTAWERTPWHATQRAAGET